MRTALLALAMVMVSGCGGDSTAPKTPVTVTALNRLDLSVNLWAGGTNYGAVARGLSATLTLPPGTNALDWTSAKRHYSDGSPMADDLDGGSVSITRSPDTLDVSNVVGGVPYFSPRISSDVADTISLQVVQPAGTRCLGAQWGITSLGVSWGYYRMDAGTTLRVYTGPRCAGAWYYWTYEQLSGFDVGTGVVRLRVTQAP